MAIDRRSRMEIIIMSSEANGQSKRSSERKRRTKIHIHIVAHINKIFYGGTKTRGLRASKAAREQWRITVAHWCSSKSE